MKKIYPLLVTLILTVCFGADMQAQTMTQNKEILKEMVSAINMQAPIRMFEGMEVTGATYDGSANRLIFKYLISNPELFRIYLTTPHEELQAQTLDAIALSLSQSGEGRSLAEKSFGLVNPHIVCEMSNGEGTKVKCEFEGSQVAERIRTNSSLSPRQQARNLIDSQISQMRGQLPLAVDEITALTDFSVDKSSGLVVYTYDLEMDEDSFTELRRNPYFMRERLTESLLGNTFMDTLLKAAYGVSYVYYCSNDRSLQPLKVTFTIEDLESLR